MTETMKQPPIGGGKLFHPLARVSSISRGSGSAPPSGCATPGRLHHRRDRSVIILMVQSSRQPKGHGSVYRLEQSQQHLGDVEVLLDITLFGYNQGMSEITTSIDRDAKNGRFLAGNAGNGGRRPGARSKLGEAFVQDLAATWETHGVEALRRCALEEPSQFVRVIAGLMPRDVNLSLGVNAADFVERFRNAQEMLGNGVSSPSRRSRMIEHNDVS